jgi:hypothetical protein
LLSFLWLQVTMDWLGKLCGLSSATAAAAGSAADLWCKPCRAYLLSSLFAFR